MAKQHKYDAFVSFSHIDDRSPSAEPGCVTAFCNALNIWLSQRLGRDASIWRDDRLSGQCVFDDTIREAIENSAVLLVLFSAGYAGSEYCAKEREWFAKGGTKIDDQSRVLTIRLVNIPFQTWPKELQGCAGFDFFSPPSDKDKTGYPLRPKDSAFDTAVQNVVIGIEAVLKAIEAVPEVRPRRSPDEEGSPEPVRQDNSISEEREFALLKERFKNDFQQCLKQIRLLSARKELHDQLHELQFKFYIPVLDSLPAVGSEIDGQLLDIVRDHSFILLEVVDNLRAIVTRYKEYLPDKERAFPEEVAKAHTMVEDSIRRLDLVSLRTAVRKIDRVLGFWPSHMNAKLTENARDLSLGALANELQQLCDKSVSFKQQLGGNASQLEVLERQISELATIHDDWQSFDDKLRVLEATLTQSLQDIEDIWPDLKGKAAMFAQKSETWAKRLVYWGGEIDEALKRQNIADVKRCFIRFSSAVRERFYVADQNLKTGCQTLQRVGDPIEEFLKAS
jgi:hypothetical protein